MMLELASLFASVVAAYMGATIYRRRAESRQHQLESSRNVEAERILSLLSARQPGVWDLDELRDVADRTARRFWAAPTREDLEAIQPWVRPEMVARQLARWPEAAVRREVIVTQPRPPVFVHVTEGGPGPDRVIVRFEAHISQDFFRADGVCIRTERHPVGASYHVWHHHDGQGWRLEAISERFPSEEPPSSALSCGIRPGQPPRNASRRAND